MDRYQEMKLHSFQRTVLPMQLKIAVYQSTLLKEALSE